MEERAWGLVISVLERAQWQGLIPAPCQAPKSWSQAGRCPPAAAASSLCPGWKTGAPGSWRQRGSCGRPGSTQWRWSSSWRRCGWSPAGPQPGAEQVGTAGSVCLRSEPRWPPQGRAPSSSCPQLPQAQGDAWASGPRQEGDLAMSSVLPPCNHTARPGVLRRTGPAGLTLPPRSS